MEDHKLNTSEVFAPPPRLKKQAHVRSMKQYSVLYKQSIEDPEAFWDNVARDQIDFFVPYTQVTSGTLEHGDHAWFPNGKLNVAYNCLDRHLPGKAYQTAILWEGDEPGTTRSILYLELYRDVCRLANALKRLGVRKGDAVCIYLPMVPFAAVAMLACSRIGAVHRFVCF
jgi:acetyl-CoA synthetase